MWSARTETLANGQALRTVIDDGPSTMTFAEVLRDWQDDRAFRSFFTELLTEAPFSAFRWETPPISLGSVHRPFEFVLLDSPELASVPNPHAFADRFGGSTTPTGVISFPNLSRDAVLIVPCPIGPPSAYGHLASFLREGPESQTHALWRAVAEVTAETIGSAPIWLSTAGAGVAWLHVRIDKKPKYYRYAPYRATEPP
jgi:hypothetical protein